MESDPPPHRSNIVVVTRASLDSRALCVVCGALAIGRNFDAYTCLSCKAFFRRNGYNEQLRYTCRVQGVCEITVATRRHCSACRLNKCFQQGMKKELIRSLIAIQNSTNAMVLHRPHHPLTSSGVTTSSAIKFNDLLALSTDDWSLLGSIRSAYEEHCIQPFLLSHQTTPLMLTTQPCRSRFKLQRIVDLRSKYLNVIASFMKRVVQLDPLANDYYDYIKDNFQVLLTINSNELMKTNALAHLPWEHDRLLFESVLTENLFQRLENNLRGYQTLIPYDPLVMKLYLIVLALTSSIVPLMSKDHYQLQDFDPLPARIVQSQEYFLTLLWKYVIYRLDYRFAVIYSVRLIQNFLRRQTLEADLMDTIHNRDDQGQLLELIRTATNF